MKPRPGSPEEREIPRSVEVCEHNYVRKSEYVTISCTKCPQVWQPNDIGFDEAAKHVTRPKPERERVGSPALQQCGVKQGVRHLCPKMWEVLDKNGGLKATKRRPRGLSMERDSSDIFRVAHRSGSGASAEVSMLRYCPWCGKKL